MKITVTINFDGGELFVGLDSFEEVDTVLAYAQRRGLLPAGSAELEPASAVPSEVTVGAKAAATVEQAQQAMKAYAAKHGIEQGRELLAVYGLKRTSEITDQVAQEILEACNE